MTGILQNLRNAWNRSTQTRTAADSPQRIRTARQQGTAAAYRRVTSLLLMVEIMLWAALSGVAVAGRGVWISAVLLIPAGIAVWWISRWVWGGEQGRGQSTGSDRPAPSRPGRQAAGRPWELLLLLPLTAWDAVWLLQCLASVLHRLMPSYPADILRVCVPALLLLGVLLGRDNGAAYGVSLWRWTLPLAAVWVMLPVVRNEGFEQLFPLLGRGWKATGAAALGGLGALWPCALLFLLPQCKEPRNGRKSRTWVYVLLPLLLACLLAVTLACLAAWHEASIGDMGLRLLLVGRNGGSMMLSGLWSLFWLVGLMTAFCTALMAAQKLTRLVWPRCRGWLPTGVVALAAAILLWVWQEGPPPLFMQLMPWRLGLWAVAAGWAGIRRLAGNRKQQLRARRG